MALASCSCQALHPGVLDLDFLLLCEPVAVIEIEVQRQRLYIRRSKIPGSEIVLDRVFFQRIKVLVATRTQQHFFGHVLLPVVHVPANDSVVDAVSMSVG